jgi:protein-disulfide isomerase
MNGRHLLALVGLIVVGVAVSYLLQATRPIGQYAGHAGSVTQLLGDQRSPQVSAGTADLTLVVFSDYQCPACRKADTAMRAAIAEDGNVRIVYKDWPVFGKRSERAAEVALAARHQGIYPKVHHALMSSPSLLDAALREAVEDSGGDWRQLEADLAYHQLAIAHQLAQNGQEALSLGLEGTPGYLIGPYVIKGALTEREFLRAFAQARTKL